MNKQIFMQHHWTRDLKISVANEKISHVILVVWPHFQCSSGIFIFIQKNTFVGDAMNMSPLCRKVQIISQLLHV